MWHLEKDEDEQQHVDDDDAEHQSPQCWVWSHEGTVWHVDNADQDKHYHHGNEAPFGVVGGVIGSVLQHGNIHKHHRDQNQC